MKKMKGEDAEAHYTIIDPETGEYNKIKPEYCTMSRRPGIGAEWIKQFKNDVYPNDYVVINGKEVRPPRYYDSILSAAELETIKKKRQEDKILIDRYDENMDRLWVREEVKLRKLEKLVRNL